MRGERFKLEDITKIKSPDDINKIRENYLEEAKKYSNTVLICAGASCLASKSQAIKDALVEELKKANLTDKVKVKFTGCMGFCAEGPAAIVEPDGVFYCRLKPSDMKAVVEKHLVGKNVVEELCYSANGKRVPLMKDIEFFKRQMKLVLKNCGKIEFSNLIDYIGSDGYKALEKALATMTPDQVIDEMKKSGLRGRGGAGFPTWLKWSLARKTPADRKYIICNADEGDPGAFMDRTILDGDSFSVIEGMTIGGYGIGATKGYVYCRAENPIVIERLGMAIDQAYEYGILGKNLLGSGFDFDLEIRIGAGAYVCGEETALMRSVEGQRGEPVQKPPFPTDAGLFGKPTVINNVETLACVPNIILNGGDLYASIGTEKCKGTKVFSISGDIVNTGVIEVPLGITLREIVYDIGGGIPNGKKFKVAQTGGPSGGFLREENLDVKMDYALSDLGTALGSGGLVVMDENTCLVDIARYFMEFVKEESCGKCVACRIGTRRMLEILERILDGKGKEGDIELLKELSETVKATALCGLGQTTPTTILSSIKLFRDEYDEHIRKNYCRAKKGGI